jgi:hypothetical protein
VLRNLSRNRGCAVTIADSGAIPLLLVQLVPGSPDDDAEAVQHYSLGVLKHLAANIEIALNIPAGAIPSIVRLLRPLWIST